MGKVLVPVEAAWKSELIGQLTRFPAGKYDDGVDVCSLIGRGLKMMPAPVDGELRKRSSRWPASCWRYRSVSDKRQADDEEDRDDR